MLALFLRVYARERWRLITMLIRRLLISGIILGSLRLFGSSCEVRITTRTSLRHVINSLTVECHFKAAISYPVKRGEG